MVSSLGSRVPKPDEKLIRSKHDVYLALTSYVDNTCKKGSQPVNQGFDRSSISIGNMGQLVRFHPTEF